MSRPSTDPTAWGVLGPDPGPGIRILVALLLRLGIGLSLLNTGLAGYMGARGAGGMTFNPSASGLDPLFSAIPYLSIGLGLALILGFLTTPSSVAAGFFSLLTTLMMTVNIISNGMVGGNGFGPGLGRFGGDSFQVMMTMGGHLPGLLPQVALIWLSPLENHPYSLDSLIFGRAAVDIAPPAAGPDPAGERAVIADPVAPRDGSET